MWTAGLSVARMFAASDPTWLDEPFGSAFDGRLDPNEERRGTLWVEVPEQHPGTSLPRLVGEVHGRGRLTDATLDAVGREDLHATIPSSMASREPSGRRRVVVGESFGELGARGAALLVEPFGELADGDHRVGRRACVVQLAGDRPQHGDVDLGVLVLAEIVLERLEALHILLAAALRAAGCRSTPAGSGASWRPCGDRGPARRAMRGRSCRPRSTRTA